MAVFTPVDLHEAGALTLRLGMGRAQAITGISAGIENTNYFVDTDQGRWVLTVFERLSAEQLPFYLGLMQHLAQHGLPVPEPRADAAGLLLQQVAGKPAALVNALPGRHITAPGLRHVAQLGTLLARMHLAVADFPLQQPNLRGLPWCLAMEASLASKISADQLGLLREQMAQWQALAATPAYASLPRGAVHADVFCDNVLFDGPAGSEHLSGCLDFYFAGTDTLAYDLAVCLNEWCIDANTGTLEPNRSDALITEYERVRPLLPAERQLLPEVMRTAALRFWLSRLGDWHLPRPADLLAPKDPAHFERILRSRRAHPWQPPR